MDHIPDDLLELQALSIVKTPSCFILLAVSRGGGNSLPLPVAFF
jgi:hypothetical protein